MVLTKLLIRLSMSHQAKLQTYGTNDYRTVLQDWILIICIIRLLI